MGTLLAIYLNDHLAAAVAGHEMAKRMVAENRGTGYERELGLLAADIEEDRHRLERLMADLGIGRVTWKTAAAWAAEKVGRAKLNGSLFGYSPLSRLEELEGLRAGVEGKVSLWRVLAEAAPAIPGVNGPEMQSLGRRAADQAARIDRLATRAAKEALART